ncbi:MAG: 30S ribosomal protein S6 [Firmicutes bacterium]|nr:30S ribosomal protein S6 [Bacillota bacterium]MBQ6662303.1 30S ribosomal protein S6 [Bacillota bacterium]MCR4712551.1 30S ribosomal protein S6 [Clostridia bacterium]
MINYEVLFVIDPTLEDEKKEAAVARVQEVITAEGGEVLDVDVWGLRDLAYPIQKKTTGYYAVIEFKAGAELPAELDRRLRISDDFMRHIIVNKDAE